MSWKVLSSKVVLENPWYKVRQDEVLNHLSKPLTYNVIELRHASVFIIAINDEGKILLQKNYRYTIDQTIWELPAGHSEGEAALKAAARELLEEDNLVSDNWQHLGHIYQAIGVGNMPLDVCLAKNVRPGQSASEEAIEQIDERRFFTLEEVNALITTGELINATDIGAIHLAANHIIKIKEKK